MKLSEYMSKYDLSQLEVARQTGVTQASISLFLAGKRGLSLESAIQINEALGIPLQDIYLESLDRKAKVTRN